MNFVSLVTNDFIGNIVVSTNNFNLNKGDYVVFENEETSFLGRVVGTAKFEKTVNDYKIVRIATKDDLRHVNNNKKECSEVLIESKKIASKLDLNMVFVDGYFSLDKKRLYVSFLSDNRVDFRELAKRLAQKYHSRIELRQIGVRDKARNIGGIGPCGLMLCCNKFLNDFDSVSINMAKNQLLALNPNKINGVCGRLKCCLNYENEIYKENRMDLPKIGSSYETPEGTGKVIDIDVLQKKCKVELPNNSIITVVIGEDNGKTR